MQQNTREMFWNQLSIQNVFDNKINQSRTSASFVHRKLRHFNKNKSGFPGLPFDYFQTGSYRLAAKDIHVDNRFHTRHEYDTIRGTLNLNIYSSFIFSFVFKCVSPLPIMTLKLFATYRDNEYFKGRLHSPYRTQKNGNYNQHF